MPPAKKPILVLVDGENFFHQIADFLKRAGLVQHRREITNFDVRGFLQNSIGEVNDVEIRYFATRTRLVKQPKDLQERTRAIIEHQRQWKRNLTRQGVDYIAAGHLKVRDGQKCRDCQRQDVLLQEKGVDVQVAVDLLLAAQSHIYEKIYVLSSDTDLLPAIQAAKNEKGHIIYLATAYSINFAMYYACKEVATFTKEQVIKAFKKVQNNGKA